MRSNRSQSGFTVTELLVVIAIFIILLSIAGPAFSGMIREQSEAAAINSVTRAAKGARSLAVRSGRDAAAVFFFEPGGVVRITPCVKVGVVEELDANNESVSRDIFVPAVELASQELPAGWFVNGYTPAGTIHSGSAGSLGWYDNGSGGDGNYSPDDSNWVFPETGFYDRALGDEGSKRQTFMIRFQGRSGMRVAAGGEPALVLMPSESTEFRRGPMLGSYRADLASDYERFVEGVIRQTSVPGIKRSTQSSGVSLVLGDQATDTVLAGPVEHLVVYSGRELAAALGAPGLDRATKSLYPSEVTPMLNGPGYFSARYNVPFQEITASANDWFEHRLRTNSRVIESKARTFWVDRTRGDVVELFPIEDPSGEAGNP